MKSETDWNIPFYVQLDTMKIRELVERINFIKLATLIQGRSGFFSHAETIIVDV